MQYLQYIPKTLSHDLCCSIELWEHQNIFGVGMDWAKNRIHIKLHFLFAVIKQNLQFDHVEQKQTSMNRAANFHTYIFGNDSQKNMGGLGVYPCVVNAR
jgi:hypothetical protein